MEESKQANELFWVVKCRVAAGRVTCMCRKCHNVLQLPRQLMEEVVSWKHLFWTPWGYILVQNPNCSPLSKGFFLQWLFLLLLFFKALAINKIPHLWESIRVWGSQNRNLASCWGIHFFPVVRLLFWNGLLRWWELPGWLPCAQWCCLRLIADDVRQAFTASPAVQYWDEQFNL